ncbi:hypothetical protein MKW92_006723 [Papaver armeniacum]|nr:hypothetical protein MKW92_006723 [Papaver armeniacum]
MSSTLLEVTRTKHEEVERFERLIVKDLQNKPSSNRERFFQNHRVRNMIEAINSSTEKLIEIYEDNDNARKDEIAALGGQTAEETNVFGAFYERLKEIRDYHKQHPNSPAYRQEESDQELLTQEPRVEFSGEEGHGRYLDLHELYNEYINSKFAKLNEETKEPIEYSAYLDVFSQPHKIPCKLKLTRQYREYLEHLLKYLTYFFQRIEPLQDLGRIFSKVETDFEDLWEQGKIQGWESKGGNISSQDCLIDLDYYSTVHELMDVGNEKLKEALAALGLKSGGTLQQRAERLFLTKHTPGSRNDVSAVASRETELKGIALKESKMKRLFEILIETIKETKENVQKKQALTVDERMKEVDDEGDSQEDIEDEDDEQQIYNPLKLPMGYDGKPIPYWLYKLHGLGQEFKCEICGSHSYRGRRDFERHFKEGRHQHGMRCLGIPNTKNFNEITSIQEAKELWEKIQASKGVKKWRPDLEEEYEDNEGNIYNKKTFTDLKRQGLI